MVRILGIDPGSRITGYGVIEADRGELVFVACGVVKTTTSYPFANRINEIFDGISTQGLFEFKADSPKSVLSRQLRKHTAGVEMKLASEEKLFHLEGGKYSLL